MSKRKYELSASIWWEHLRWYIINASPFPRDNSGRSCAVEFDHCWTWFIAYSIQMILESQWLVSLLRRYHDHRITMSVPPVSTHGPPGLRPSGISLAECHEAHPYLP